MAGVMLCVCFGFAEAGAGLQIVWLAMALKNRMAV